MTVTSIGDLAQSLVLRTRSSQLKQTIATLTEELSSGRTADVTTRLGGDISYLADIDRNLTRLSGFAVAASEATLFARASQTGMERLHDLASDLSGSLISLSPSNIGSLRNHTAQQARAGVATAIAALNASAGGRSLFAGTATDRAPLGSADTLLDALRTELAGLTSQADLELAATGWFDDPAGFRATMYAGSDQSLAAIEVGSGQEVALTLRADDPAFRDMLRNMAMAALATDPTLGLDADTQNAVMRAAGEGLLADQDVLAGLRADLGFAEARIEEAGIRNASARTGLEYARGALLEADPYDTATRLEEVQFQLEALYSVTVRTSRLTVLSFL